MQRRFPCGMSVHFVYLSSQHTAAMPRRLILSLFFVAAISGQSFCQITAVPGAIGIWNLSSTWIGGVVPSSGDSVIIPAGSFILIDNYTATVSSLTVHGNLEISTPNSSLNLLHSFINTGTTTNDGDVIVERDFTNSGSVFGSGAFCISDSTLNTGTMYGSFDFCDLTPPSNPPYIDINTGTFSTGISFCLAGLCSPASVNEPGHGGTLNISVDATAQTLTISLHGISRQGKLHVFDAQGRQVFTCEAGNEKTAILSTASYPTGIYSVVFHSGNGKLARNVFLPNR
jgi:G8 domain